MPADRFNADFPAAIVALIPLILIVSAVDAGVAREWMARRAKKRGPRDARWWSSAYPYAVAWGMLVCGFSALVVALFELRWRTNRFDLPVLVLGLVPVAGLLVHLWSRVNRQLTGKEALPKACAPSNADIPEG